MRTTRTQSLLFRQEETAKHYLHKFYLMRRGRSPNRPLGRTVTGAARLSSVPVSASEYRPPARSLLTRPMDAVLPGGVATRRPPPTCPRPIVTTGTTGALTAVLAAVAFPSFFGWGSIHPTDFTYGACGAMAGAFLYSGIKLLKKKRPKILALTVFSGAGVCAGVSYNAYRMESVLLDWSEEVDKSTGETFFFNQRTGASQWESPIS